MKLKIKRVPGHMVSVTRVSEYSLLSPQFRTESGRIVYDQRHQRHVWQVSGSGRTGYGETIREACAWWYWQLPLHRRLVVRLYQLLLSFQRRGRSSKSHALYNRLVSAW